MNWVQDGKHSTLPTEIACYYDGDVRIETCFPVVSDMLCSRNFDFILEHVYHDCPPHLPAMKTYIAALNIQWGR